MNTAKELYTKYPAINANKHPDIVRRYANKNAGTFYFKDGSIFTINVAKSTIAWRPYKNGPGATRVINWRMGMMDYERRGN